MDAHKHTVHAHSNKYTHVHFQSKSHLLYLALLWWLSLVLILKATGSKKLKFTAHRKHRWLHIFATNRRQTLVRSEPQWETVSYNGDFIYTAKIKLQQLQHNCCCCCCYSTSGAFSPLGRQQLPTQPHGDAQWGHWLFDCLANYPPRTLTFFTILTLLLNPAEWIFYKAYLYHSPMPWAMLSPRVAIKPCGRQSSHWPLSHRSEDYTSHKHAMSFFVVLNSIHAELQRLHLNAAISHVIHQACCTITCLY